MSQGAEALRKSWFNYVNQPDCRPGSPIDHSLQLDELERLASSDPEAAQQKLDELLEKEEPRTFNDRERHRVRDIEDICFSGLNQGQTIDALANRLEVVSLRKNKHATMDAYQQAKGLMGWRLHFRETTQKLISKTYIHRVCEEYRGFGNLIKHLYKLTNKDRYWEIEQELNQLFDSHYTIPGIFKPRVRSLVGLVAARRYGLKHPIEEELNRVSKHHDPQVQLDTCQQLMAGSKWFSPVDWLRHSCIRLDAAKELDRPDLAARYAREIPQLPNHPKLLEVKLNALIETRYVDEALAIIHEIYSVHSRDSDIFSTAKKLDTYIHILKAEKLLAQGATPPADWHSDQPATWRNYQKYMFGLHQLADSVKKGRPVEPTDPNIAYVLTHLETSERERFIKGVLFHSNNERVLYNTHLLAVRGNQDDSQLWFWENSTKQHPETKLPGLFANEPPRSLEVLTMRSPCHNPEQGSSGCIQTLRDLARWYPECIWDYRFIHGNFMELSTTGHGYKRKKQIGHFYHQEDRKPYDCRLLPCECSQMMLDIHELNLYPNMSYGCIDFRNYHAKKTDCKPHNIDPLDSSKQLKIFLPDSMEQVEEEIEYLNLQDTSSEQKETFQITLIDHLERTCSLNLFLLSRDRKIMAEQMARLQEDFPAGLKQAISAFNDYLFNKRNQPLEGFSHKAFKTAMDFIEAHLERDAKAYALAALSHCHAVWLRQQWFPESATVDPMEASSEETISSDVIATEILRARTIAEQTQMHSAGQGSGSSLP